MLPGRVGASQPPTVVISVAWGMPTPAAVRSVRGMADDQMSGSEMRQRLSWGAGIAIGMGVGVATGSALDNMGMGIAIGIAIGVVFAIVIGRGGRRRTPPPDQSRTDADDPDSVD